MPSGSERSREVPKVTPQEVSGLGLPAVSSRFVRERTL